MSVSDRLSEIRAQIAELSPHPDRVEIVAVTKKFPVELVAQVATAGIKNVGENYAQELLEKAAQNIDVNWHFIGQLQRNKVKKLAPVVDYWHSVSSVRIATEIASRSSGARVFLQVNAADEEQKAGCPIGDVPELAEQARRLGLDVRGLMAMGPTGDEKLLRTEAVFAAVAELNNQLGFSDLSIGMSSDYHLALKHGATHLRLGQALFGERPN